MKACTLSSAALCASLTVITISGCSGNPAATPPQAPAPAVASSPPAPAARGRKVRAWLSPEARNGRPLIYAADFDEVLVYPEGRLNPPVIGAITAGIDSAYGLDVDRHGDLYVANQGNDTVTVYPPGSLAPSAIYSKALARPLYPLVDRAGDLFVGNANSGNVVEYLKGSPKTYQLYKTPGNETDGMDVDRQGNLYVAYRKGESGSIEKFAAGSTHGQILGMHLDQPQSIIVTTDGTILATETGGRGAAHRVDVFTPGSLTRALTIRVVRNTPTQLAITAGDRRVFVSTLGGEVYAALFPLFEPNGSAAGAHRSLHALHRRISGIWSLQGIALSNGQGT